MVDQESSSDIDFAQEMEALLDQHDYELPKVGDIRDATIVNISPQGIIVDLGLKRDGIIPQDDLEKLAEDEREALQVNDDIPVYIMKTDDQESLLVSLHMARMSEDWLTAQELLDSGEIIEAEIIGHNRGGALVPFGRLRGFVPASHLTFLNPGMDDQQRQQRMAGARGEVIPLKVIEVDRRRRRLVLSHRDAERVWQANKRRELLAELEEGDVLRGTISGWKDFGVFIDLGGADGLVHVSELAWHRVNHPREVVKMGEEVEVQVLKIDRDRERISLSRKRLLPNPWTTVEQRFTTNQLVEGKIIRIVDYGAFVEVEPGIEGLLHTSQISRGSVDSPHEVLNEGEVHLLRIISINAARQRMGLSLKAVTANEQIEWMTERELAKSKQAAGTELPQNEPSTGPAVEEALAQETEPVTDGAEVDEADTLVEVASTPEEATKTEEDVQDTEETGDEPAAEQEPVETPEMGEQAV